LADCSPARSRLPPPSCSATPPAPHRCASPWQTTPLSGTCTEDAHPDKPFVMLTRISGYAKEAGTAPVQCQVDDLDQAREDHLSHILRQHWARPCVGCERTKYPVCRDEVPAHVYSSVCLFRRIASLTSWVSVITRPQRESMKYGCQYTSSSFKPKTCGKRSAGQKMPGQSMREQRFRFRMQV
jgi:hypothetical protein